MSIMMRLRKGYAEEGPINDRPGQVIPYNQRNELVGFLTLMNVFMWDSYIATTNGNMAIITTNDEGGFVYTKDNGIYQRTIETIKKYSVDLWERKVDRK
jgi:hypothetical protein